jgi:N6-L-threonylcarbamoyladenine synthase
MNILAFESSCDETSVAIVQDGHTVLSNVVWSQMTVHQRFGGVVPEVASREHVKGITLILEAAFEQAQLTPDAIDAVAVTEGPGLIGSVLVGLNAAKAWALAHQKPLLGVHHIAGHIYAANAVSAMTFPLIALVVSGGHTELLKMDQHLHFELLGQTLDDAIGEAFDKVARVLNLGYPGGPAVEKKALEATHTVAMPRVDLDHYNVSYSGLKSHVINTINTTKMKKETLDVASLAHSFQEAALQQIVDKTRQAVEDYGVKQCVVAGGVAANQRLRVLLKEALPQTELIFPPMSLCTDNAAMIGLAAYHQFHTEGVLEGLALHGYSRQPLTQRYERRSNDGK